MNPFWPFGIALSIDAVSLLYWCTNHTTQPEIGPLLIATCCIAEGAAVLKVAPHIYATYHNSHNILDFAARLELPMVSGFFKNARDARPSPNARRVALCLELSNVLAELATAIAQDSAEQQNRQAFKC